MMDTVEKLKQAEALLSRIEVLFPNWRGYRDLVDCIEVELHVLRSLRGGVSMDVSLEVQHVLVDALEKTRDALRDPNQRGVQLFKEAVREAYADGGDDAVEGVVKIFLGGLADQFDEALRAIGTVKIEHEREEK